MTIRVRVHIPDHNRPHLIDELATLGLELIDALRQGPILAALVLLMILIAIQVLVGQVGQPGPR